MNDLAPDGALSGTVRHLVPSDLDRAVAIDRDLSGSSRRGFFEKRLGSSEAHPESFVSLGYTIGGGELEGLVLARIIDGEFGTPHPAAFLDAIGTTAKVRGQGGARLLLDTLMEKLKRRGVCELRTQTLWSDRSLSGFFASAGFSLWPGLVLERVCGRLDGEVVPGEAADSQEDLSRDRVPVRLLKATDLPAVVAIDRRITGRDRTDYYRRKFHEVLNESGIRLSMIATLDDTAAGFIMARVDYGEFGMTRPEAVMDTIGVDPELIGRDAGSALLTVLLGNLGSLMVETVRTEVSWNNYALLAFLEERGFRPSQRLNLARAL